MILATIFGQYLKTSYLKSNILPNSQFPVANPQSPTMPKKQKYPHLLNSKWTSQKKIDGWRHFRVINRKNQSKWVYAEMVAACDPKVRFWINAQLLKDRSQWEAGWLSLQEMHGGD